MIRRVATVSLSVVLALLPGACSAPAAREDVGTTRAALDAVAGFGTNPGNLLMYRYVPASTPANAPLVVVLHGCEQAAADIAAAGWDTLADQQKFYVVYPQQQSANNPAQCFDWFGQYNNPADKANITRGQGENLSIKQMVDKMKGDFSIDPRRVFVAGFSSGAAMAAVMLAAWPDVFAAGGIDAGIAYDCPSTSNPDVWTCMNPGKTQTADQWGQAVKAAFPGWAGPWPRVSIWQGTQDYTVGTANEAELVKQWTFVHGLSTTPTSQGTVASYPHSVYADPAGDVLVEEYQITGMAHGMSVDVANGCGTASQYLPDMHICTAAHMLQFFGLVASAADDGGAGDAAEADASPAADAAADAVTADAVAPDAAPPHDAGVPKPPVDAAAPPGPKDSGAPSAPGPGGDGGSVETGGSGIAGCNAGGQGDAGAFALAFAIAAMCALFRRRNVS
jgi:poly(hydroxyalkanoate) depolymerase family esterase